MTREIGSDGIDKIRKEGEGTSVRRGKEKIGESMRKRERLRENLNVRKENVEKRREREREHLEDIEGECERLSEGSTRRS